ncbi:CBS domain-containing protein [Rhodobacterales bacterium HKCCE3408]|nr:CBS domain-containing protein [Rhodobacterales bacterium HKCCE3408]
MADPLSIRSVMETDILRVPPSEPIRRAIASMTATRAQAVAVVEEDGTLAGILTEKDCFRPALHASYYQEWRGTVAEHMSAPVVTIEAGEDLVRAAEMFLGMPHRVFPVLDKGELVGMLSRSDVMAALFEGG